MTANAPQPGKLLSVESLTAGAALVEAGDEQLLCGFPEEVAKACLARGKHPTAWLVPDVRTCDGIAQWALEFPLYVALFVDRMFEQGRKLRVAVHRRDWSDVVEYLRLTLLGLTRGELEALGIPAQRAQQLAREAEHFALKRKDGSIAQIEDFLEPVFFDESGLARIGALEIASHGDNRYTFVHGGRRIEHRLQPGGEPAYAARLRPLPVPLVPQRFEAVVLGSSNGFDPSAPCSSLVVQADGHVMLIDAGPYVRRLLEASGIAVAQVEALVLTHAHEDHAVGLSALLNAGRRIRLFATRETREVARRKVAILNRGGERLFDAAFEWIEVRPGTAQTFWNLELRFHETLHSIPCVGVELAAREGSQMRRVLVTGDACSKSAIESAAAQGAIDADRRRELEAMFERPCDLLVADAGGGPLHGLAADFEKSPARELLFLHAAKLGGADAHRYSLASAGQRVTLIADHAGLSALEREATRRALERAFPHCRAESLAVLLESAAPLNAAPGQVLVRQGEASDDLFAVISGGLLVEVETEAGVQPVAALRAGEIFGEMAALLGKPRTAHVRATTAARLVRVPGSALREFAARANPLPRLRPVWRNRSELQRTPALAGLPLSIIDDLARSARRERRQPGARLIAGREREAACVMVAGRAGLTGRELPFSSEEPDTILAQGALISATTSEAVALDECEVLAWRARDLKKVMRACPLFRMPA